MRRERQNTGDTKHETGKMRSRALIGKGMRELLKK